MRILRLTPEQARAVSEQLTHVALFVRQIIDAFAAFARSAAEALQPLIRLSEQLRAMSSYRPDWANHFAYQPGRRG